MSLRLSSLMAAISMIAASLASAAAAPPSYVQVSKPADEASHAGKAADAIPTARVSSVTVTATLATPHVQSTFPAAGAKVAPGLLVMRVTYDTRMRPDGWSYAREAGSEYPDCASSPRLLDDGRSFVLICRTLPAKTYAVWFNRPPLQDFSSRSRRPAVPFELKFTTTDDDPVRTLPDAMKADPALAKAGNPVEGTGLAVYGQDPPPGGD